VTLRQSYTGCSPYQPDSEAGIHSLLVAVECRIGDFPNAVLALLDTASHWCVLPPAIAEALGYSAEPTDLAYLTRFGRLEGRLHLISVFFVASEGDTTTSGRHLVRCQRLDGSSRHRLEGMPGADALRAGSDEGSLLFRGPVRTGGAALTAPCRAGSKPADQRVRACRLSCVHLQDAHQAVGVIRSEQAY
jgi:hypothetical protein